MSASDERTTENNQSQAASLTQSDLADFRELLVVTVKERKKIQLPVEYISANEESLENKVSVFKKLDEKYPDLQQFSTNMSGKLQGIKKMDQSVAEAFSSSDEAIEKVNHYQNDVESLNLLVERINSKIKGLSLQRVLEERASFDKIEVRVSQLNAFLTEQVETKMGVAKDKLSSVQLVLKDVERFNVFHSEIDVKLKSFREDLKNSDEVESKRNLSSISTLRNQNSRQTTCAV